MTFGAVLADLREAGRDHDDRRDPLAGARPGRFGDGLGRDGDHCEVDLTGDVADAGVGAHRLDDLGGGIDRVDDSAEAGVEHVVEDLAADGPASPRRTNDRHRPRLEEAAHRSGGGKPVSLLEAIDRVGRERGRELEVDGPGNRR